ncbi:SGNH/GDSL hydrolase family protein [Streptomyces boncukensis]|uniref:SGNH/GDSL hydrolase family protein n=1 Tax=Streptomyces boncukensis TaxID=2711219 RepID=A0A6G4WV31_9ACTN|nr:SGNH/GDSL hydrolase family protein [Streptomyces boncukensis]NGO68477.1 SGNH/GDSL hydrolase family protein [Streptomyces boncukensis]
MSECRSESGDRTGSRTRPSRRLRSRSALACTAVLAATATLAASCGGSSSGSSNSGSEKPKPSPTRIWDRSPDSLAAVGDSITRGFDACSVLSDCVKVSWATGSEPEVKSLAHRLLRSSGGKSWNYAKTGAVIDDLAGQMLKAAAAKPEMVTVMSGANDACAKNPEDMTSVSDYRAGFKRALRVLRAERPTTQVYVSSVPDLRRLWEVGKENVLAKQVWKLGICQSVLKDSDATDQAATDRRTRVRDRVKAYNSVLKDECAKDRRCRYDNGAVFSYRFTKSELSKWDWFHPNKKGQGKLAELAYERITERR